MSTKLNQAVLKVAQSNPKFAKLLQAELAKQANWPLKVLYNNKSRSLDSVAVFAGALVDAPNSGWKAAIKWPLKTADAGKKVMEKTQRAARQEFGASEANTLGAMDLISLGGGKMLIGYSHLFYFDDAQKATEFADWVEATLRGKPQPNLY